MTVEFEGPLALNALEGSHSKVNWFVLNDTAGNPISGIQDGIREVEERPKWVRHVVAADAAGPQPFYANIGVKKESD